MATTKLEAVNQMLSSIGQARVNQLSSAGEAGDAQKVLEEIDTAVQSEGWHFNRFHNVELAKGTGSISVSVSGANITTAGSEKHFLIKGEKVTIGGTAFTVSTITSDTAATLSGSPSGTSLLYADRVAVPTNVLNIDVSQYRYSDIDPVVRGKFLYDRRNATYKFDSKLEAIVTYQLLFNFDTAVSNTGEPVLPEYARRYITTKAARVFSQRYVGDKELVQMLALEEQEARTNLIHKESENADYSIFNSPLSNYTVDRQAGASVSYTSES
tara:strand:+ start:12654 stop:13463 length:810 start_codon:yes stop_codon:yes gene_type:complete